jgi:Domain of unknown function (DUF4296)
MSFNRIVIIFCFFCLANSCRGPKTELLPPHLSADSVFTRDEMIHILADIHLIEATIVFQRSKVVNISELSKDYYHWLYSKYHMSGQRLKGNLDYYKMDVRNFSKMYQDVVKNLADQSTEPEQPHITRLIETSSGTPNKHKN